MKLQSAFPENEVNNSMSSHAFLVILAAFILSTATSIPALAQEQTAETTTTFIVVRHAERAGDLDELSEPGEQRANLLATIGKALKVQAIYSTNTARTKGTARPLANTIDTEILIYRRPSEGWLASLRQKHAGQVVLIVGHSNTAGVIAGMLAKEKPFVIKHDEYDSLFIVQASKSEARAVRLRFGVSSTGAASISPNAKSK